MTSPRTCNLVTLGLFFAVIAIIFWQIETDLEEQGITSGGPYDNAASYPQAIAIFVGVLLIIQLKIEFLKDKARIQAQAGRSSNIRRPAMMLTVFAIYLMVLTTVGYHLATAPLIFMVMWICGMRHYLKMTCSSATIATCFAFLFEVCLNVVLPLGIWNIFIPW